MFVTKKVFDPNLIGKAVLINGLSVDGDEWGDNVLIKGVHGEKLELVNLNGARLWLHIENFEKNEGDEWEPLSLTVLEVPQKPEQKTMKQKIKKRTRRRTDKEMRNDADIVKAILKRHTGPMQLQDILKAVNEAGCDWYERSATGHIYKSMEIHPAIKKVGFGFYEYQQ